MGLGQWLCHCATPLAAQTVAVADCSCVLTAAVTAATYKIKVPLQQNYHRPPKLLDVQLMIRG